MYSFVCNVIEFSSKNNNLIVLIFKQAQMVRRVKAYLNRMRVITDEEKLHELSLECEGARESGSSSGPIRKRNPSPTLSTASSASSASEGTRKHTHPKFGKF
jgi:Rap guanine nucleotide exchange factor 2